MEQYKLTTTDKVALTASAVSIALWVRAVNKTRKETKEIEKQLEQHEINRKFEELIPNLTTEE